MMHKTLLPRDDMYVSRKGGGREVTNIQNSVDASIQKLNVNIRNAEEDWLQ